jgi:iron-sulfur cluster assembly accessory protein
MEVTTLAIEKLKEVIDQEEQPSSLRVVAMPAEQGGLQYLLTMEKETQEDDTVMSLNGVSFVMDSDSAPFLEEATIDYVENFGGQVGFVINNPLYASAGGGCGGGGCGCGDNAGGGGGCGCGDNAGGGGGCGCGDNAGGGGGGGGCGCGGH